MLHYSSSSARIVHFAAHMSASDPKRTLCLRYCPKGQFHPANPPITIPTWSEEIAAATWGLAFDATRGVGASTHTEHRAMKLRLMRHGVVSPANLLSPMKQKRNCVGALVVAGALMCPNFAIAQSATTQASRPNRVTVEYIS